MLSVFPTLAAADHQAMMSPFLFFSKFHCHLEFAMAVYTYIHMCVHICMCMCMACLLLLYPHIDTMEIKKFLQMRSKLSSNPTASVVLFFQRFVSFFFSQVFKMNFASCMHQIVIRYAMKRKFLVLIPFSLFQRAGAVRVLLAMLLNAGNTEVAGM